MEILLILLALAVLADALVDAWGLQQSVVTGDGWEVFSALADDEPDEEALLHSYRVSIVTETVSISIRAVLAVAVFGHLYAGG